MMKNFIICLFIIAISTTTNAQIKGGAGFFKTGYINAPGASDMFKKIAPAEVPRFTNNFLAIGVEAYYRTGKNIIGWDGYVGEQHNYLYATNFYAEPYLASTHIKLGRIIKQNKQHWLYPSFGVGPTAFFLATYDKVNDKSTNTITKILLTPSFDLAINEDFLLTKNDPEEKRYGGSILGVRAGFQTSLFSTKWRNDNGDRLNNMPSYANNYFYITVSIGAGGFINK